MTREYGLYEHHEILVAHLLLANGALAEDRHGDYRPDGQPCSIGIIQWHLCIHEGMTVPQWLAKHPEWGDWRFQVRHYLGEMQRRLERKGHIDRAIQSWNPASKPYLKHVYGRLAWAKELLQ